MLIYTKYLIGAQDLFFGICLPVRYEGVGMVQSHLSITYTLLRPISKIIELLIICIPGTYELYFALKCSPQDDND